MNSNIVPNRSVGRRERLPNDLAAKDAPGIGGQPQAPLPAPVQVPVQVLELEGLGDVGPDVGSFLVHRWPKLVVGRYVPLGL